MLTNFLLLASTYLMCKDGPTYHVEVNVDGFEIRRYDEWTVAETIVEGTHQTAGYQGYHVLSEYISGGNDQKLKLQMVAPVNLQQTDKNQYLVQFFMPKGWTPETLPKPKNQKISIKKLEKRKVIVKRYWGSWSDWLYLKNLKKVQKQAEKLKLETQNEAVWARYNSPWVPRFLRTNEIWLQLKPQQQEALNNIQNIKILNN